MVRDTSYIASTYTSAYGEWNGPNQYSEISLPYTYTTKTSVITVSENWMYAPLFQLRWKSTDRPPDAPGDPSQPTATDGSLGNSTVGASSPSRALSTGAKAGVGVGVGLAGLLLLGALAWFLTKYRRRRLADAREARASDLPVKETTARATAGPPPMPGLQHGDLGSPQQPGSWRDSIGAFHQAPTPGKQG